MMRRQALVVLVAAAGFAVPAAAKDKDLATSLKGNWVVDKLAAFEASAPPFYKAATPEKQKAIRDDMLKGMPDMIVEFTATTAAMRMGKDTQLASYKVTRQEKNTVWLDLVPQDKTGPAAAAEKYSLEFVDQNTVKMLKEGDPAALLLKRQK